MSTYRKYLLHNAFEYLLVLLIIATAAASLFLLEDARLRKTAVLAVALLYPLWGIIHHWEAKNLTVETVLEYCAVAMLMAWTLLVAVV